MVAAGFIFVGGVDVYKLTIFITSAATKKKENAQESTHPFIHPSITMSTSTAIADSDMTKPTTDRAWREFDIHEQDADEEDRDFTFNLFATKEDEDNYEVMHFDYDPLPGTISIRGKEDEGNSTGLGLWLGSEVLCQYMLEHQELIKGKRILELGAGLGLCGIVAYQLGAAKVIMTDGDKAVLDNLRFNVEQNRLQMNEEQQQQENTNDSSTDENSPQSSRIICPQLIWNKDLDVFAKDFGGPFPVLISSDCVYLTQSLEPLWKTVRHLLHPDGYYLYVNRSTSQAPVPMVLEMAQRHGFEYTMTDPQNPIDSVYTFRRTEASKAEENAAPTQND